MFDVVPASSGYLSQKQSVATAGTTPRHFLVTPDGRYLLAALRYESEVEVFAINPEDGTLNSRGSVDFVMPEQPTSMEFV